MDAAYHTMRTKLIDQVAGLARWLIRNSYENTFGDTFGDAMVTCIVLIDMYLANDTNGLIARRRIRSHSPLDEFMVSCAIFDMYRQSRFPSTAMWDPMSDSYLAIAQHIGLERQRGFYSDVQSLMEPTMDQLRAVLRMSSFQDGDAVPDASHWLRAGIQGVTPAVRDVSDLLIMLALVRGGFANATSPTCLRCLSVACITVAVEAVRPGGDDVAIVRANLRRRVIGLHDGPAVRDMVTAVRCMDRSSPPHLKAAIQSIYKDTVDLLNHVKPSAPTKNDDHR